MELINQHQQRSRYSFLLFKMCASYDGDQWVDSEIPSGSLITLWLVKNLGWGKCSPVTFLDSLAACYIRVHIICKTPLIADIQLNSELMGEIERGRLYVILTHPGSRQGYLMKWSSWHHKWLGSLILLPHAPKSIYSLVFCKDNRQIGKEHDILVLQIQVPFKYWWYVPSQT